MPAESNARGLEALLDLLLDHGVDFIIVGGQAEVLHGSSRTTFDVDLCYRRSEENLESLARVLRQLHPSLRDAPQDLPFVIDARSLALGSNFTFDTALVPLDLLGWVPPIGTYDDLIETAENFEYKGRVLHVIGLDDLIRIKEFLGRPKDRESLLYLRAIKQSRDEESASDT